MKRMATAAMGMASASMVARIPAALLASSITAAVIVFAVIPGVAWVAAMASPVGSRIATVPAAA